MKPHPQQYINLTFVCVGEQEDQDFGFILSHTVSFKASLGYKKPCLKNNNFKKI